MSETLVGVIIGGVVAVGSALISAVVEPWMSEGRDRKKARAVRVHEALRRLPAAITAWHEAALGGGMSAKVDLTEIPKRSQALVFVLEEFKTAANDDALRSAAEEARTSVLTTTMEATAVEVLRAQKKSIPDKITKNLMVHAFETEAGLNRVSQRAMDLADPLPLLKRVKRSWKRGRQSPPDFPAAAEALQKLNTSLISLVQKQ